MIIPCVTHSTMRNYHKQTQQAIKPAAATHDTISRPSYCERCRSRGSYLFSSRVLNLFTWDASASFLTEFAPSSSASRFSPASLGDDDSDRAFAGVSVSEVGERLRLEGGHFVAYISNSPSSFSSSSP